MTNVNLYFLGPSHIKLNKNKVLRLLRNCRSFTLIGEPQTIEVLEANAGIVLDKAIFKAINRPNGNLSVFIVMYELEDNWFVRANPKCVDEEGRLIDQGDPALAVTTHDVHEIATGYRINFEKLLVFNIVTTIFAFEALKNGGSYYELFSNETYDSAFNFCGNKVDVVHSFLSGRIGDRARAYLTSLQIPNETLKNMEKDLSMLLPGRMEKLISSHHDQPLPWAISLTVFGAVLGLAFGFFIR